MKNFKIYVAVFTFVISGPICSTVIQQETWQEKYKAFNKAHEANQKMISEASDQQRKIQYTYWADKYPACKAYVEGLMAFIEASKDDGFKNNSNYIKAQKVIDTQRAIINKDYDVAFPSKNTALPLKTTLPVISVETK